MANEQNLNPINSKKMAREYQKRSVEARNRNTAEKKNLRNNLEILLERDFTDKSGKTVSGAAAITAKLFEQAMHGNIRAFETIRSTVGQDPVQKIMVAEVDQNIIDEVEKAVLEDDEEK